MTTDTAPLTIPDAVANAHEQALARFSRPGASFGGGTRRAIVEEARAARGCDSCARRSEALSDADVEGAHERATDLLAGVVEFVHRLVTDPGWLTGDRAASQVFDRAGGRAARAGPRRSGRANARVEPARRRRWRARANHGLRPPAAWVGGSLGGEHRVRSCLCRRRWTSSGACSARTTCRWRLTRAPRCSARRSSSWRRAHRRSTSASTERRTTRWPSVRAAGNRARRMSSGR